MTAIPGLVRLSIEQRPNRLTVTVTMPDEVEPTWFGDRRVIPDARPGARPITMTYSLEGERLRVETHVEISPGRANTVTEWFTRVN